MLNERDHIQGNTYCKNFYEVEKQTKLTYAVVSSIWLFLAWGNE